MKAGQSSAFVDAGLAKIKEQSVNKETYLYMDYLSLQDTKNVIKPNSVII
jgi:hypothetical protein